MTYPELPQTDGMEHLITGLACEPTENVSFSMTVRRKQGKGGNYTGNFAQPPFIPTFLSIRMGLNESLLYMSFKTKFRDVNSTEFQCRRILKIIQPKALVL